MTIHFPGKEHTPQLKMNLPIKKHMAHKTNLPNKKHRAHKTNLPSKKQGTQNELTKQKT
jgi:hypothetical protein